MEGKGKSCDEYLLAKEKTFASLNLDPRIDRAIEKVLKWNYPSLVQVEAIPLALQGKDILARAKTGSGKTGAYSIPIIQKILLAHQVKNYINLTKKKKKTTVRINFSFHFFFFKKSNLNLLQLFVHLFLYPHVNYVNKLKNISYKSLNMLQMLFQFIH